MTEKNIVPNLEPKASDGNTIFIPRHGLERFRQFTKRELEIDITPLLKREDITIRKLQKGQQCKKILFREWDRKPSAI